MRWREKTDIEGERHRRTERDSMRHRGRMREIESKKKDRKTECVRVYVCSCTDQWLKAVWSFIMVAALKQPLFKIIFIERDSSLQQRLVYGGQTQPERQHC